MTLGNDLNLPARETIIVAADMVGDDEHTELVRRPIRTRVRH